MLGSDYVRTARAKGLRNHGHFQAALRKRCAGRDDRRPASSGRIAGAVLVETVFTWPGLGQLAYESICGATPS